MNRNVYMSRILTKIYFLSELSHISAKKDIKAKLMLKPKQTLYIISIFSDKLFAFSELFATFLFLGFKNTNLHFESVRVI